MSQAPTPSPNAPKEKPGDAGPTPEAMRAAGLVETGAHGDEVLKEQLWAWRWRIAGVFAALVLVKGISSCIDFSRRESEKKGQAIATGIINAGVNSAQAHVAAAQAQAAPPPSPAPPPASAPQLPGLNAALAAADDAAASGDASAFTKKCRVVAKTLKTQGPTSPIRQAAVYADLAFELTALCEAGFNSVPVEPWRALSDRIRRAQSEGAVRE